MQNHNGKQNSDTGNSTELVAIVLGTVEYSEKYFHDENKSLCKSIRVDIGTKPYGDSFYGAQKETYFIGLAKSPEGFGYIMQGELKPTDPINFRGNSRGTCYAPNPDWLDICNNYELQELPEIVKKVFKDNIKGRVDKSEELNVNESKKLTVDEMKELINALSMYKKDK